MRAERRPARRLRLAIDSMPLATRVAMRDALDGRPIIVGAYTDPQGGVCPMLAAHRNGGRTSCASFARAWDRYTRAGRKPRPATGRELRALAAMLDASIAAERERGDGELGAAIAEHRALGGRRRPDERPESTGERDRTSELEGRLGWAWLRPFRRLDDYESAMRELAGAAEKRERQAV